MKKIKYCAALFALSITMQPGIVLADPSGIANKVADAQVITQKNLQKTITGVVMDTNGESIIGATVLVKGTSRGTATDIDGRFTINAAEGDELEFRYVGYITVVEKVKKDTRTINIRMEADAVNLEDVVIVGYGQQKKESVVASMSTIGPAELHVSSRSLNNNIAGKISGVIAVQRSGEPGWDDAQFWIRGVSSDAGGTDPLVLVDGVPRSMSDIDVDEIESFTVLKDASATAVYGAEGANGVILVTSKRGKQQKTRVNVSAQYGISTPMRVPSLLNSYDYLSLYNEAQWNDAGNPQVGFQPTTSDEELELYRNGSDPDLYPNTDWMSMLRKHTQNQRYTINFRGGGERVRFFVSGAYYTEDGIYKKNKVVEGVDTNVSFKRYNLRSNVDFDLTKTTKMAVDMSGQYINRVAPSKTSDEIFSTMTLFPTHLIPMIFSDGTPAEHYQADNGGYRRNPFNYLYYSGYSKSWKATIQSKISLEQQLEFITKGLSVKGVLSFDAESEQYVNRTMTPTTYYVNKSNGGGRDSEGNLIYTLKESGSALSNPSNGSTGGSKKIYIEASLNYKNTFAQKHDVTGMLLYNQKETQKQNQSGFNLLPYRKQSVVGRFTYGFDNRYMLEGSFGMTGSENFAKGERWGIFPAIGGAWFLSHEKFMQPLEKVVNKLKLRASYGRTGNDDLGNGVTRFPYRPTVNANASGYNLGINALTNVTGTHWIAGASEQRPAAPLLHWEIEDKINAGFDLGLFEGRIDMSVDYFSNRRHDILETRNSIPSMTGLRQGPLQNFSIVTNKGIDGNITYKEHFGKLNMTFRGNFTYTKNKIIECDEIKHVFPYQDLTGNTIGTPFIYIADGLYTPDDFNITRDPVTGAESYELKSHLPNPGAKVSPGDIKYRDLNNDNVIDGNDQTYLSGMNSQNPKCVYGFAVDFEYKGFFGGIFFQGSAGTSVNLMAKASNFMPFNGGKDASSARTEAMNRWTASNPYNQNVLYPRMHTTAFDYNLKPSTWWYRDASFLRLKNIEFGYQFNKKQLRKLQMQNLRLYVQATNLATWDKVKYWDPELSKANSGAKYPLSSTWTIGLEVTF